MKKNKNAKKIWIVAIFLELIIILVMIIDYKIHYQYLTQNKLYFYECDGNLCVTEVEDNDHLLYSTYDCNYEICPTYKKEIGDTHILLEEKNTNILYNYRTKKIVSKDYDDYHFLNNQYIIVIKDNKQGIINIENQITINPIYDELGYKEDTYLSGYNLNYIIAKKASKYGIVSFKTGEIIEPLEYSEDKINELLEKIKLELNK